MISCSMAYSAPAGQDKIFPLKGALKVELPSPSEHTFDGRTFLSSFALVHWFLLNYFNMRT